MFKTHKRGTSESIKQLTLNSTNFQPNCKIKTKKPKSTVYSLVAKSNDVIPEKQTIVEDLDQQYDDNNQSCFFAFGRRGSEPKKWQLDMDKITQVQDSNSRRQITSHRSQIDQRYAQSNKQNILKHSNKSQYNIKNIKGQKTRNSNTRSCKTKKSQTNKSFKKSTSNSITHKKQKTKSTIQLSKSREKQRLKINKSKNHSKNKGEISDFNISKAEVNQMYQHKTDKLEKNVKILWECIGQLWENSRVSQYKSEKNTQNISDMKKLINQQQQKILQLKFQIHKAQNTKTVGLRY